MSKSRIMVLDTFNTNFADGNLQLSVGKKCNFLPPPVFNPRMPLNSTSTKYSLG